MGESTVHPADGFLRLLPPGGAILELGCGAGNHAAVMLADGFVLRATDGSPEMAEVASRRINHPVEAMRFDELEDRAAYDGVLGQRLPVACAA